MNLRAKITSAFRSKAAHVAAVAKPGPELLDAQRARADAMSDRIQKLLGEIQDLKGQIKDQERELSLTKEAASITEGEMKRRTALQANQIAARMGCPPLRAEDHSTEANGGKSLLDQYLELNANNPKAAAQFAAQHGGAQGLLSPSR